MGLNSNSFDARLAYRRNIVCSNCGRVGHLHKYCPEPVASYGVLAYTSTSDGIRYVLVQRRDSFAYVEFVRGKYSLNNGDYLLHLLANATQDERHKILTFSFEQLWADLLLRSNSKSYNKEFENSSNKFQLLRNGCDITFNGMQSSFCNLDMLLGMVPSMLEEREYGIPKGRRASGEDDLACALREFHEETGIDPVLLDLDPSFPLLEELFVGSNQVKYRHVYYVARVTDSSVIGAVGGDPREIKSVHWLTFDQVILKLRPENIERIEIFRYVHNLLTDPTFHSCYRNKNIITFSAKDFHSNESNILRIR